MYLQLKNKLYKTHKNLYEVCKELDVPLQTVDISELTKQIDQCTHCNVWDTKLVPDLDGNLICKYCVQLIGL